jgi:hypothetical protein
MRKVILHINDNVWTDIQQAAVGLTRSYREVAMHCIKIPAKPDTNFDSVESLTLNSCTFESIKSIWNLLEICPSVKRMTISYPNMLNGESLPQSEAKDEPTKTLDEFRCSLFLSQDNQCCQSWQVFKILKLLSIGVDKIELKLNVKDSFNGLDQTDEMIDYLIEQYSGSLETLEVLGDNCSALFYTINQCQAKMANLSLQRLKICVRTVNAEVFEQFMATQTKLQHFQFDVVTAENPVRIIYPNLTNLISLHLSLRGLGDTESLCEHIASLTKLETLKLDIFDGHTCHLQLPPSLRVLDIYSFSYPTVAKIFRFHNPVMKDMEELMLTDVFLEIDEMSRLLEKMPNLRRLRLCDSHTPWEGLSRNLRNLQKLHSLELTQQYMHDTVLLQIQAPLLTQLVWMHSYNDFMVQVRGYVHLLEIKMPKISFHFQRITDRTLHHLDATCPALNLILHGSGNTLFRRNTKTQSFEKYWLDY